MVPFSYINNVNKFQEDISMKKTVKKLSLILSLALVVLAFGMFAAACGDDDKSSNSYDVKLVYADGSAVDGTAINVTVQICLTDAAGETVNCYLPKKVAADGTCSTKADELPALKSGEKFHIQVNLPDGYSYDESAANLYVTTPGSVTVTITKN